MDLNLLEETSAICSDSWELLDVRRDLRERCLMRRARRSASVWVDCFITLRFERRGGALLSSSIFEYLLVSLLILGWLVLCLVSVVCGVVFVVNAFDLRFNRFNNVGSVMLGMFLQSFINRKKKID